ncbi:hypothetical protein N7510_003693 [Penicillium lagena]|uniref:uncharacterized protein n=1 Tax=Penicillium lagena TaxID=94218 RepID=UPI002540666B|nr:uncharacterized protein N7510_003693 [Penicillium lagena]KAJ5619709.1 hypothetical protein N7510_003693 [Penicillium lagena]
MQLKFLLFGLVTTAAAHNWQAAGGCKTNWGGRCLNTCKTEAKAKNYSCTEFKDDIWKSDCFLGWEVCDCGCW